MRSAPVLSVAALLLLLATAAHAAAPTSTVVDFSNGTEGWVGNGSKVRQLIGHDAPAYHTRLENFGITYATSTNTAFLGDYTQSPSVTLGLDINAYSITYFGAEVSRNMVVELRDYDSASGGMPYTSVWFDLGTIQAGEGWKHLSVTIADTSATALPEGWGGYGAENDQYEPILPPGMSFADVLSGVDEIAFTTYVPGWMYGFTIFDMAVDNLAITAVPEPSVVAMQALGLAMLGGAALRRRRQGAVRG
jgi:hypothetical protein